MSTIYVTAYDSCYYVQYGITLCQQRLMDMSSKGL